MRRTSSESFMPASYPYTHWHVNPLSHNISRDDCPMNTKKLLSSNLIRLRELKGYSQNALAEKCPTVAQSTVSRIENMETAADVDTIGELATALGVSPWQLLSDDDARVVSKGDAELLASVKRLATQ